MSMNREGLMISRLLALAACLAVSVGSVEAKLKPMMKKAPAPPAVPVESYEPGMAEPGYPGDVTEETPADPEQPQPMLKVSFKLRFNDMEKTGNFLVLNATQSNYVVGGDEPWVFENSQGKGVEFKKHGTIVNMLPAVNPIDPKMVDAQIQVELSGPGRSMTELKVPPVTTFQLQTEYQAPLGRKMVLVDEPDKRVEVTVELYRP